MINLVFYNQLNNVENEKNISKLFENENSKFQNVKNFFVYITEIREKNLNTLIMKNHPLFNKLRLNFLLEFKIEPPFMPFNENSLDTTFVKEVIILNFI